MFNIPPSAGLAYHFTTLLEGFCLSLRVHYAADVADWAKVALVWNQMSRRCQRFANLFARFRAGTLRPARYRVARGRPAVAPTPEPPDAEAIAEPAPRRATGAPLGSRSLGALYAYRLACLIAQPDGTAFLTACPQARGMVRSIWRTLCADPLPAILRPQARPGSGNPVLTAPAGAALRSDAAGDDAAAGSGLSHDPWPRPLGAVPPDPVPPDPVQHGPEPAGPWPCFGASEVGWLGGGQPLARFARCRPTPLCVQ